MSWFVIGFLRSSLAWLVAAASLGVAMAVHPAWTVYRTAHLHMMLLGFVTMMIAGVAYHILPRFASTTLHSDRVAGAHLVLANTGLSLMVLGFILRVADMRSGTMILATGGTASTMAIYAMAWNLWRTLDSTKSPVELLRRVRPEASSPVR